MSSQVVCASQADRIDTVKTLKAGIVGAGRMGITHLALLGSQPNVNVVAIADDSQLMNRALTRYRPDIRLFTDFTKMLKEAELDLVLIATPPHLHAPMIDASLDAKLSVFVEKPFTLSAEESRRLTARSREVPGTYQVGYVNRFNDVFMTVKQLIDEGILGRLFTFRSDMFGRTVTRPSSSSGWRGKRETGGGCLYEFGSHAIDLMVYLLGRPALVKGTSLTSVFSTDAEDMVCTNVVYSNGLTGSLTVNWSDESFRKPTNKVEILGEHGKILADQHQLKIYLNRAAPPYVKGWNTEYITDCFTPVPFYVRGNEFTRQICHFVERVLDPAKPNLSGFSDATVTQEVIDMVFADASVEK
jgi:predicted dehydrogenase